MTGSAGPRWTFPRGHGAETRLCDGEAGRPLHDVACNKVCAVKDEKSFCSWPARVLPPSLREQN